MQFNPQRLWLCLFAVFAVGLSACETISNRAPGQERDPGGAIFLSTVKPLIESRCVWCHSNQKPGAGLNFQDRVATLDPAAKFIVPGQPEASRVYRAVTQEASHPRVMPGDGWGITTAQKAAIKKWIEEGAAWPDDRSGRIRRKPYRVDHEDYL